MAEVPAVAPAVKPHISPSQLSTYENCGEAYRRRYIEKEVIPPGVAALRGGAVHKGAEMNFKHKLEAKTDLPAKDIVDRAVAEFDGRMKAEGLFLAPEEQARGMDVVVGEEKDATARLAGLFAREVAPVYQPTSVEDKVRIELPSSPRDILGILDLTATIVAAPEKGVGIIDYKTGRKTKLQRDFDVSPQLSLYDLTFRSKHGKAPDFIQVEQLIALKSGDKRVVNPTTRSTPDFKAAVARVNAMVSGLEKGVFMPAAAGSWNCAPKWCGYFQTCPYVNAERRAAAEE
jgi:hypothetical protein